MCNDFKIMEIYDKVFWLKDIIMITKSHIIKFWQLSQKKQNSQVANK